MNFHLNFTFIFASHYISVFSNSKITFLNAKALSDFILISYKSSPNHIQLFLQILSFMFYLNCFLFFFQNFTNSSNVTRYNLINIWKYSRFKPLRDFIRYHEILFDFYSISKFNNYID